MSELKILNEGVRYSHGTVGSLSGFDGKVFVKDGLKETSCEISFGMLAPGQMVPFFHSHKENEENYIVLSGCGLFQIDDDVFPVYEGSVIRVAANCDRNIKNTAQQGNLTYVCIQAKEGSLNSCTMTDAEITVRESKF
ncbi:cupin domain-containing protein [uncultured Muribaculum sp.]|uniref:cupin domain-containing protein n=1 Tax=uncultured Muribaculum sp. TaxID=1918613 RepID=UPI0025B7518C|nr:cupin domain-containing protein [uncultured Muribaculum sp.]